MKMHENTNIIAGRNTFKIIDSNTYSAERFCREVINIGSFLLEI